MDYGFWLEAKRCATGRRRIRSEICRSPGESGAEKLFGFGEEEALCAEPLLLWAKAGIKPRRNVVEPERETADARKLPRRREAASA